MANYYICFRGSSAKLFLGWAQGSGHGPVRPNSGPPTADHGLPIRSCQTTLRPLSTVERFSNSHSSGYPARSESRAVVVTILPNNHFVRWFSANTSQ